VTRSIIKSMVGLCLLAACAVSGCERKPTPQPKPAPNWVAQTRILGGGPKRIFDENVELGVSILNTTGSPVVISVMNRDDRVLLVGADGTTSKLHRLSIGVAKPILLKPGEEANASLLFEPLRSEPKLLRVYDKDTALTALAPAKGARGK
jgi:hypothetical protein